MVAIAFKAIKPQRLKIDAIRLELLNELRDEGRDQRKELNKTISSWNGEKPKMESDISLTGKDATVISGPTGSGSDKWEWLNRGTKIRWALMSNNWRSKTKSGTFMSGRGSGRVVIAGKRAMQARNIKPRPGIKARGWTEKLTNQRKKPFQRRIIKAMQRGTKKAF